MRPRQKSTSLWGYVFLAIAHRGFYERDYLKLVFILLGQTLVYHWSVGWLLALILYIVGWATLHCANADCQRWPNVATDAGPMLTNVRPTLSSWMLALRRADGQNNVGQRLFYILGQHTRSVMDQRWPNIVMLSGIPSSPAISLGQFLFMELSQHTRTAMGQRWLNIVMLSGIPSSLAYGV